MNTQQIINEMRKLPPVEQRRVPETINQNLEARENVRDEAKLEREVVRRLMAKGLIKEIPSGWNDDEDFEPIEIKGKLRWV